jgi:hypothetical protein
VVSKTRAPELTARGETGETRPTFRKAVETKKGRGVRHGLLTSFGLEARTNSIAAFHDRRRIGRNGPLLARRSRLAPWTAHRPAQELRLLVMRHRRTLTALRHTFDADIRLRRTILTIRPLDPLRTLGALEALLTRTPVTPVTIPAIPIATVPVTAILTLRETAVASVPVASITTVAAPIATMTVAILERAAAAVVALRPVVETLAPVVVARLAFAARLGLGELRLRLVAVRTVVAVLLAELIGQSDRLAEARRPRPARAVLHVSAALSDLLLPVGHDDAIVVLGMLQIVFRKHWIATRKSIPRQSDVFLCDMSRCPAQLHVGTGAFKAPR